MIDVDRLKEDLDRATVQVEHGIPLMPSVAHALFDAARLLVEGQPLWRCTTHSVEVRWSDATNCVAGAYNPESCRMVEGVWVPTGKED